MTLNVSGSTKLAGVVGWPLGHTLSPAMHNAVYEALGLDWVYLPLAARAGSDVADVFEAIRALPFVGINVTLPHKALALELCDETDEFARLAGAVNTVTCTAGTLRGSNTDGPGLVEALASDLGVDPAGADIVVCGAGGAASGAVAALARAGARSVAVLNRGVERARSVVERIAPACPGVRFDASPLDDTARAVVNAADLIVNATTLGMNAGDPSPIPASWLRSGQVVADMVYRATPTPLVAAALEAGARACDGLGMLACQGAIAVDTWRGSPGEATPREVMRSAAQAALTATHATEETVGTNGSEEHETGADAGPLGRDH